MASVIRRMVAAGALVGVALVGSAGPASAQTVTVTVGPIEIIQRVGKITLTIEPGEIIYEGGMRVTILPGEIIEMPVPPQMEILEGEELIFYLPRQSFTYDAGVPTDGGTDGGGGGGGPDCGPTGCGG